MDLQNPRVIERLIGHEGASDFLYLLGFEPDELGIKLMCTTKPSPQVCNNAITTLQKYLAWREFANMNRDIDFGVGLKDIIRIITNCEGNTIEMMNALIMTHVSFVTSEYVSLYVSIYISIYVSIDTLPLNLSINPSVFIPDYYYPFYR